MRIFLTVLIFYLFQIPVLAQTDSTSKNTGIENHVSDYTTINLSYGRSYPFFSSEFQNYFVQQYNSNFGSELEIISLNCHSPVMVGRGWQYDSKVWDMNFGINHKYSKNFKPNDSTSFRLRTTGVSFALGRDQFYFWKNIDLAVRLGADFGMANLKTSNLNYRNPFFDLIVQVEPRIILWKISLSVKAEAGFDITSPNWKPKKNGINAILPNRNHYYSLMFSIGFRVL